MIEGNPQPLTIASSVLKPETLREVRRLSAYDLRGWRILDRWAFHSPDALRRLEAEGETVLLIRLLEQQQIEQQVMLDYPVDMPEIEALALAEVRTELV